MSRAYEQDTPGRLPCGRRAHGDDVGGWYRPPVGYRNIAASAWLALASRCMSRSLRDARWSHSEACSAR